jgi:hypothetical protein
MSVDDSDARMRTQVGREVTAPRPLNIQHGGTMKAACTHTTEWQSLSVQKCNTLSTARQRVAPAEREKGCEVDI